MVHSLDGDTDFFYIVVGVLKGDTLTPCMLILCLDDLALLANTPAQAESPLHIQKQAAGGISLNLNTNKTEFMCF